MTTKERIRDLLVEAVLQSDGGPDDENDRWQAEDIADDIMRTAAWGDLMRAIDEHYRDGFRRAKATTVYAGLESLV